MTDRAASADDLAATSSDTDTTAATVISSAPSALGTALQSAGATLVDQGTIRSRGAARLPAPTGLNPKVLSTIMAKHPLGLYRHQARAIAQGLAGHDVCLTTPTCSGKSLVFQAIAAHHLLDAASRGVRARALILYPLKALTRDQEEKWTELLRPLGLSCGVLNGDVHSKHRAAELAKADIVLATPDIVHSWILGSLCKADSPEVRSVRAWVQQVSVIVLDEAHTYDGAFGTNMAFFLRRLDAVIRNRPIVVASTATIGDAAVCLGRLTGRTFVVVGPEDDGSPSPERSVVLAQVRGRLKASAGALVGEITRLAAQHGSRALVFIDSRQLVSHVHGEALRTLGADAASRVAMYKGGYEEEDARAIEKRLRDGTLVTVISTSALEAGIDIPGVDIVVMLGRPPSFRAFWQRLGRAGRTADRAATVLLVESSDRPQFGALATYLGSPVEPMRVYLDNEPIQAAHALCAASERNALSDRDYFGDRLESLPADFAHMVAEARDPLRPQRATLARTRTEFEGRPHDWPLRGAIGSTFSVESTEGLKLGKLDRSQRLREAYPGAVYVYNGMAYRVRSVDRYGQRITVGRSRGPTRTEPTMVVTAFPKPEVLRLRPLTRGWVAEATVDVKTLVTGFRETRSASPGSHTYGPGSQYSTQPLYGLLPTTGLVWTTDDPGLCDDNVLSALHDAASRVCEIDPRDLGTARFHMNTSPVGGGTVSGACLYDAVPGSLRLTGLVADHLLDVVEDARVHTDAGTPVHTHLTRLQDVLAASEWAQATAKPRPASGVTEVIRPGSRALFTLPSGEFEEVEVKGYRFTPSGLKYQLLGTTITGLQLGTLTQAMPGQSTTMFVDDDGNEVSV